jgi:hypothetical protein
MPTYAIVYATATGALRRVVADDDGEVSIGKDPTGHAAVVCKHQHTVTSYNRLKNGESAFVLPAAGIAATPAHWKNALKAKLGYTPAETACALLDANNVVENVIMADPDIDDPPDHRPMVYCYSPVITTGYSYDPQSGLFSTPPGRIEPGAPGNDGTTTILVPPQVVPKS